MQATTTRRGFTNLHYLQARYRHSLEDDDLFGRIKVLVTRDDHVNQQRTFVKKKVNDNLTIVKVVNNLLRSTVIVTYARSSYNNSMVVDVHFKRYRHNTVEQYGMPCRITSADSYNLAIEAERERFANDVGFHMRVTPDNLKTVKENLPVRLSGFDTIEDDCLYAMEIFEFKIVHDPNDRLNSMIELSLVNDVTTMDKTIRVRDIVNFNDINDLVGRYFVTNYKGAYKIKTKEEILQAYTVVNYLH